MQPTKKTDIHILYPESFVSGRRVLQLTASPPLPSEKVKSIVMEHANILHM